MSFFDIANFWYMRMKYKINPKHAIKIFTKSGGIKNLSSAPLIRKMIFDKKSKNEAFETQLHVLSK